MRENGVRGKMGRRNSYFREARELQVIQDRKMACKRLWQQNTKRLLYFLNEYKDLEVFSNLNNSVIL